jgi:hypothetical protein
MEYVYLSSDAAILRGQRTAESDDQHGMADSDHQK